MKTFHVPHFSTEVVTESEMMERPFTLFLGPSREQMTWAVESTVRVLAQPHSKVALISHQSSVLLSTRLLAGLQRKGLDVMVETLVEKDIRPSLVRIRKKGIRMMIVDISSELVKAFLYQVCMLHDLWTYLYLVHRPCRQGWCVRGWCFSSQLWYYYHTSTSTI